MSHSKYHTEAIVLASRTQGESSLFVFLLTERFGLVGAVATGIRHLKSKLRYSLVDFSLIEVSLVRGKEVWRLTGARKEFDHHHKLSVKNPGFVLWVKILSLIRRLTTGEEAHQELFTLLKTFFDFIRYEAEKLSPQQLMDLEVLMVIRILRVLGYFGEERELEPFISTHEWKIEEINNFTKQRRLAVQKINDALKETQL
ncbi:MAG: recombination protein O N-terminal domain-containing protein [bacterium]